MSELKIFFVFFISFLVILGVTLILPLYPIFEKEPQRELYEPNSHYFKYREDNSVLKLLFYRNGNSNTNEKSQTLQCTMMKKPVYKSYYFECEKSKNIVSVLDENSKRTNVTNIITFDNDIYALDSSNGILYEINQQISSLIPRHIFASQASNNPYPMNIQFSFVKDNILHIISNDSTIVALDDELRTRWGNWTDELSPLFENEALSNCSSKRITTMLYLRSSFEFLFLFGDCRTILVTDVEYNVKEKHNVHSDESVTLQSMKFVPYNEKMLILLASKKNTSKKDMYDSFAFLYDLNNPNKATAENVIDKSTQTSSTPYVSFDII